MVSGAVVSAVAFHMPALAEHFVDHVHEILIVEGIEIFTWVEFQLWVLVRIRYSLVLIILSLPLVFIVSILSAISVISISGSGLV